MFHILIAVFIAAFVAHTIYLNYRPGLLPGPFHLPILGAGFQLGWLNLTYPTYQLVTKLAKKYGEVFRLQCGVVDAVVLTDLELMKDVLASEDWESRPINAALATRSFGKDLGLLFGNGEKWKESRRFTTKNLKNLGFGRTTVMEDIIRNEVEVLIADIDARNKQYGTPIDIQVRGVAHMKRSYFKFYKVIADMIAEMRRDGSYLNEQNTFFDLYLKEIDRRKESGAPPGCFFDEEFITTVIDLVVAGYETAAKATEAGLLSLILYPRVQKKIQAEVDAVVGTSRQPDFGDIKNMPYTHATILETLRIASVLPQTVRFAHKETTFGKYTFPAKTYAFFNIYGCHMDPKNWDNPTEFRPERFLDENMKIVNTHKIIPFGHGKRLCPGETVARAEIFTFISALMQRYTIEESVEKPAGGVWLQYHNGFTLSLPPFHGRFVLRDTLESART